MTWPTRARQHPCPRSKILEPDPSTAKSKNCTIGVVVVVVVVVVVWCGVVWCGVVWWGVVWCGVVVFVVCLWCVWVCVCVLVCMLVCMCMYVCWCVTAAAASTVDSLTPLLFGPQRQSGR